MNDLDPQPAADDAEVIRAIVEWSGDAHFPPAMDPLLARFPDSSRPNISVARGWWPLLVKLNQRLAALDPTYRLGEVKAKFSNLRFYVDSRPGGDAGVAFSAAIRDAEAEADQTCVECGMPGVLCVSRSRVHDVLCPIHAGTTYRPLLPEDDEGEEWP